MKLNFGFIVLILIFTLNISGCVFVGGAIAGAAAIAIVYDHRGIQNAIKDTEIANKIVDKFKMIPGFKENSHVEVAVFNRIVLITGETPNAEWKQEAQNVASTVPNVEKVYNQLRIEGPTSTLTHTSDAWITTKIKTQMLTSEKLKTSSIKVITENGTVFLMGVVTHSQADVAVDIARKIEGVQQVIKIFQYEN